MYFNFIVLEYNNLYDDSIKSIGCIKSLNILKISKIIIIILDHNNLTNKGVSHISKLPNLL